MMPKDVRVDGTFWQSIFFVVPFLIPVTIFMHILEDFMPKIPAKFHSNSLLKKCYFFLFILHNKCSGKNMPCKAGGVPPCKKYQIASNTRFAGYLFEALLRIENSSIPCSQIDNADGVILQASEKAGFTRYRSSDLIRWKRKYNKQGGVRR